MQLAAAKELIDNSDAEKAKREAAVKAAEEALTASKARGTGRRDDGSRRFGTTKLELLDLIQGSCTISNGFRFECQQSRKGMLHTHACSNYPVGS